jgi:hypothetical protein
MIIRIIKEAPAISGNKKYKVGREIIVTNDEYAEMLISKGYGKKLDERFSFIKEIRKARTNHKTEE